MVPHKIRHIFHICQHCRYLVNYKLGLCSTDVRVPNRWGKSNVQLRIPNLSLLWQDNVGSCSDSQFVDSIAPVPNSTSSLDYSNQFLCDALCEATFPTANVPPLRSSRHDPFHSCPPSLPLTKRNRYLKRNTSTSSTFLRADAHERCNGVYREGEI